MRLQGLNEHYSAFVQERAARRERARHRGHLTLAYNGGATILPFTPRPMTAQEEGQEGAKLVRNFLRCSDEGKRALVTASARLAEDAG